jgi:competence protein ComEC
MPAEGLILIAIGGLWLAIWTRRWRWLGLAPVAAGYLSLLMVRPPDLLVSGEGGLVAVRAADGSYLLSRKRGERFTQETWTQRSAAGASGVWPKEGASADGRLTCTRVSCVYRARGRSVALIRSAAGFAAACDGADLVVSPMPAPDTCRPAHIIDSAGTAKNGAHAVWLEADGVRIETVADWRGTRRWTAAGEEP